MRRLHLTLVALLFAPSLLPAAESWPITRGASREPVPYRFDPKVVKTIPKEFLDDAVAVIIYAGTSITVEKDGTIETTTHEITRLGGRKAIEKLGEFRGLTYTPAYQKATLNEARIHKVNGKVVQVEPRHVHLRDVSTDYQVYDPDKQLIISFPSLEVGDILEVKWTVRGKNPEHGGQYFNRYSFGDVEYPVMLDEYRVRVPKGKTLKHAIANGKPTLTSKENGNWSDYHWKIEKVKRLPRYEDMPSREELRPTVMVSTFETWAEVGKWKKNLREKCWTCTEKVKKIVEKATKELKTPEQKARALTYWVRRNIRYVAAGEKHDYTPHIPEKVLGNRFGDCKDTAQLLAVMLRQVGIKVELVTLGALDDGQIHKDVPSPWGSHAILLATIDGKNHWIDTTSRLARWDELPKDDCDRLCYLTDEKGTIRLLSTPALTADSNRYDQTTELWVDDQGHSRGKRVSASFGLAAISARHNYDEVPPGERRRKLAAELQDNNSRSRLLNFAINDQEMRDHDKPVRIDLEFEIARHFTGKPEREGNVTDAKVWNRLLAYLVDPDRTVPLELPGPFESTHRFIFHLPVAYAMTELPSEKYVKSAWGTFEIKVAKLNKGKVIRDLEVVFKTRLEKTRVEVKDLEKFRAFTEEVNKDYRVYLAMRPVTDLESAGLLETLLTLSPQNSFAASTLAKIYVTNDRLKDARRVLLRAAKYSPEESILWELLATAAESPAEEEKAQRELVKRFPAKGQYKIELASTLISADKHPEARKLLADLIKNGTKTEQAKAHYQMARSHYRKDELKPALAELDLAEKTEAEAVNTVVAHALRGQLLEELKRPADALKAYKTALSLDRSKEEILLMLIRLSIETKDKLGALEYLRTYTQLVKKDVTGLLLAAGTYLQLGHDDEALELAIRVRNIRFHEKAQRIMGLVYLNKGEFAKAITHLDKAEPDSIVLRGLLDAGLRLGRLGEVETWVEKAEKLDKPTLGVKQMVERAKKILKRRAELAKVVTIPAGKAAIYNPALDALACAEALRLRGERKAKVEKLLQSCFKDGVTIGPAHAFRGRLLLERGKLALALKDAEKAITQSPKDPLGYYVRGRVRLEREAKGAFEDLQQAVKLSERKDAASLHALAECQWRAGKLTEALATQREAVKLAPKDREYAEQLAAIEKAIKDKTESRN